MDTKSSLEGLELLCGKVGRITMGLPGGINLGFQRHLSIDHLPNRNRSQQRSKSSNHTHGNGEGGENPCSWKKRDHRDRWGDEQTLMVLSHKTVIARNLKIPSSGERP